MASFSVKLMHEDDIRHRMTKQQRSSLSDGFIMLFRVHHIVQQHPDHQDHRVTIKTSEELLPVDSRYLTLCSAREYEQFMYSIIQNTLQLHIDSHGRFLSHNGDGVQLTLSGLLGDKPIPIDCERRFSYFFDMYIFHKVRKAGYKLAPILIECEVVRYHQFCGLNEAIAWWESTPINPQDLVPAMISNSPFKYAECKLRVLFGMSKVMNKDSSGCLLWPKQCSICLEELPPLTLAGFPPHLVRLYCKHVFHEQCITQWFEKSYTCPVCRFSFGEDSEVLPLDFKTA